MFNLVVLTGRLTADPELKTTANGIPVTTFSIAVDRRYRSGEERQTDFINIVAWRQSAEFITKYFKGNRQQEIDRNITPQKYHQLFNELSDIQSLIINDAESKYIVVAAGPGSGKTRVLVHKLASLLILEDVKHEQLLMLTFSRAAATEFKKRLRELIGNAANFVDIKTFHSYCFDLLGKIGSLERVKDVVQNASDMILSGEVEPGKIIKNVLKELYKEVKKTFVQELAKLFHMKTLV